MLSKEVGKRLINEEDFKTRTIIGEPLKEKLKATKDPIEAKWMKDLKKQVDQLQTVMKKNGLIHNFADLDLDLEEEELLAQKFKFLKYKEVL